ncbi:MAG: hypothetical protein J2P24_14530 [Streptosporangiales bacterium]|nr:hypothetical protein [Streptosporangiales bacterium]
MSTRVETIVGFCVLFALGGFMVLAPLLLPRSVATFGEALRAVPLRRLVPRLLIVLVWAWLGWHFLARTT